MPKRDLSLWTAKQINWNLIDDGLPGVYASTTKDLAVASTSSSDDEHIKRVRTSFKRIQDDFERVMTESTNRMNKLIFIAIAVLIVALAVALILAFYQSVVWATVPNLAGAAAVFGLITRFHTLLQDQKYLLIPSRYELAISLVNDRKMIDDLIQQFLTESKPGNNKP